MRVLRTLLRARLWGVALLLLGGCVQPYEPKVAESAKTYLVVDGFINTQGSTSIKLSRTLGLAAGTTPNPETKASAYLGDDAGNRYALTESPAGTYNSASLTLDASRKYQLHLTTATGKTYLSDFVAAKTTPPIDSVTWKYGPGGVQLYVSAHDDKNQTTYYRWSYGETWLFTSAFYSHVSFDKASGTYAKRTDDIYNCWTTVNSTLINLGNTAKLTRDVLDKQPLLFIADNSPKLRYRYSILVQQHAQSAEEYHYWEALKKNTESIGSLYDPLPTQLTGNVHATDDATEPVLGFVGAHSVTETRIFIDRSQIPLPPGWVYDTGYQSCGVIPMDFDLFDAKANFSTPNYMPIDPIYNPLGVVMGYTGASPACVDCRLRGTNVKPSFWK
ncbi:DUF4249 domain-containing protein [Hymenobacter cheonanensis]|uniref:DUF4249 domain-containing protein n=1 Tax=Hymenobacter sp. CA2-7 TaxID=3063993 RepID=UPI002712D92C|nr:DUF4249 domain-containing protein [Hymenobacter sp. CA2-7]MDO7885000.1 DUF4249 domain-containing protein [Hymenobacter sp. CA2-7]